MQRLLYKRKSPLWKHQDSDEAADEVNSLPESQRMSNNDIVEAVDQDENITIVTIDSNSVIIDSGDKIKGQLISKCPFGITKLTKKSTKFL